MFKPITHVLSVALALALIACAEQSVVEAEPAAGGTGITHGDPRAIELAGKTMQAMGGRDAWESTRYLTWNFFGVRRHVWDKHAGDIRVEWNDRETGEPRTVLMNLDTGDGRAFISGAEVDDEEQLDGLLSTARSAWINDSYWLFMPYKLRDDGVTLRYVGERETSAGESAEVIELTFDNVGQTPENKYHVYIDPETHLIAQWDFFRRYDDDEPALSTPWLNWRQYGTIKLSGDRGEGRIITDIGVADNVPRDVFESPDAFDRGLFQSSAER